MSQPQRNPSGRSVYWQDLVDQWSRSGLSQAAFCRERGITYGSFTWWKRQLLAAGDGAPRGRTKKAGVFVEVQVPGSAKRPAYELILARGRVLRIYDPFDSDSVSRLITAVESC